MNYSNFCPFSLLFSTIMADVATLGTVNASGSSGCWSLMQIPEDPLWDSSGPRTSILTDEWRTYKGQLSQYGYSQYSVCHKRNFVDPETGAHTQHVECAWQNYKLEIWRHRDNRTPESLKTHRKMIEWHHWLGVGHYNGVLGRLFHDVKKLVK